MGRLISVPFHEGRGDQPRLKLYNEGSLLLCEEDVCAPWHKTHQSTKKAPELPRIPKRRSSQNAQKAKFAEFLFHALR